MKLKSVLIVTLFNLISYNCSKNNVEFKIGETLKDIDGNVYHSVIIGSQVWMVENLKTIKYRNGDQIPNITVNADWSSLKTGAYCDYKNNTDNSKIYGRLYNWYAVNDSRNIAPAGWHVPTDAEWEILITNLGGKDEAGIKLKEVAANNEIVFAALPSGYRSIVEGTFEEIGNYGCWWSSTDDNNSAWCRWLYFLSSDLSRYSNSKSNGFSIRCLKD